MERDKGLRLDRCSQIERAPVVMAITEIIGWEKLWDAALDEGSCCIQWMKHFVKTLCHRKARQDCPRVDLHTLVTEDMLAKTDFNFLKVSL